MKFGYACQNISNNLTTNKTIRLSSFTEDKFFETAARNIDHLSCILGWNRIKEFQFFRIGSQIIPFASHPVCCFDWDKRFGEELDETGILIKENSMRISMHPDQFVVINSPDEKIVEKSVNELQYHCDFLDLLGLDSTAKVQIHVGGVYGDKHTAMRRFVKTYNSLNESIRSRLVIENDDRLYSVSDCLSLHEDIGIPIIFDNLHHECLNEGEPMTDAMQHCFNTWQTVDGMPMIDFSQQEPNARVGNHCKTLDEDKFIEFYQQAGQFDFDMMLEIKDKEASALRIKKLLHDEFSDKVTWIDSRAHGNG